MIIIIAPHVCHLDAGEHIFRGKRFSILKFDGWKGGSLSGKQIRSIKLKNLSQSLLLILSCSGERELNGYVSDEDACFGRSFGLLTTPDLSTRIPRSIQINTSPPSNTSVWRLIRNQDRKEIPNTLLVAAYNIHISEHYSCR